MNQESRHQSGDRRSGQRGEGRRRAGARRHISGSVPLILAVLLFLTVAVFAPAQETRAFTDSAGRTVEIPTTIRRIAPSGSLAQLVLFSLVPDRVMGWASTPSDTVKAYLPREMWSLPTFGQFYGRNVNLNLEALIAADPDVIVDIGEAKPTIRDDMDRIQQQTGIPVVFIEATLDSMPQAYRTLGQLTGQTAAAEDLARYVTRTLERARTVASTIPQGQRVSVYYGEGQSGLQTNPVGSIHADVIDIVGARNVAEIPITSGSGGNEVSMEQLYLWDPDLILFGPDVPFEQLASDPLWLELDAVAAGRVYQVPEGPYNWMGRPPSVNRVIGISWFGELVYPQYFNVDLEAEARRFYELFYHYELRDSELEGLLVHSR